MRHFASGYQSWPQIDEAAGVNRVKRAKQRGKKRGEVIKHIEITPTLSELIARLRRLSVRVLQSLRDPLLAGRFQDRVVEADEQGVGAEEDRVTLHVPRPARVLRDSAQGGTWRVAGSACESGDDGARLRSNEDGEAGRYVIPN